jgi:hypothetical protein
MSAMLMTPVTGETFEPEKLWERLMIERGFLSSPSGVRDAYRAIPATLPDDMSGPGAPVGKGYETLAIIQIVDKGGQRVGPLGLGLFETGGYDKHAEAEILKILGTGPEMRNGRMIVVVDTPVCPSCTSKLVTWAKAVGLAAIDTYVPERQSMTSDGMASPKTAARTAAMSGRPKLHLRFQGLAVSS